LLLTSVSVALNAVLPGRQALDVQGLAGDIFTIWTVVLPVTALEALQGSLWVTHPVIDLDAQVAAGGTARSTLVANRMGGKAHEDSRSTRVGGGSRDRAEVALEVSKTACEPATVRDQGATQLGRQGEPLIALRETVSGQLIDIVADLAAEPD
jgi:hypothetical protein